MRMDNFEYNPQFIISVRYGVTASIAGFHSADRGSIPRIGAYLFSFFSFLSRVSFLLRFFLTSVASSTDFPPFSLSVQYREYPLKHC